jgi:ubiquinone/menaquinone biosynthesis C-methylase UbiE
MNYNIQDNYRTEKMLAKRKSFNARHIKPWRVINKEIMHALELDGKEGILDIGCGFGDLLQYLKGQGHEGRLTGIDLSDGMISCARKRYSGITFMVADAEKLPFKDNSYDVVICKHMLYHVNSIPKAVAEVRRVLKYEGKFLFTLNSYANHSSGKFDNHIQAIEKMLSRKKIETSHRINMENYHRYVSLFSPLFESRMYGSIHLKTASPYVDYVRTFKHFFSPTPSDEEWDFALRKIQSKVEKEIKSKGAFEEVRGKGVVLMQK